MPVRSVDHPTEDQLAARLQLIANAERVKQRKRDARRKIITGAALLAEAEHDPAVGQVVRSVLQARVTRPIDRAVLADLLD
jgi:hypothetical protein